MQSIKKRYNNIPQGLRATFWFLMCSFLQRGISVITTPIFTRLLDTSEYGDFNVFQSWLTILTVIVTLNLPWGVYPQGLVKLEEKKDRFASSLQGLLLLLVIIWFVVYLLFKNQVNMLLGQSTSRMVAMFILMWTSSIFCFWSAYERTELRYKNLVVLTIIVSILKPLVGIYLVLTQTNKITARIWGIVGVELLCYVWLFIKQVKKGKVVFDKDLWKYALSFNIVLIPHYLSQTILSGADRIMIERMVSPDKAGIYSLAYSLSLIMLVFNSSLEQTINPWIFKQIKHKNFDSIKSVVYPAIVAVGIVNLLVMAFAPEIVKIFAPQSYYEAIWIIPPVSASVFFMFLYDMFANFEFYYEKTKFISLATVTVAILNILLNYLFIKKYGYFAAGYTTLFCYVFYSVFHYIVMRYMCLKDERQPYSLRFILTASITVVASGMIILFTYNYPYLRYGILLVAVAVSIIKRHYLTEKCKELLNKRKEAQE